MQDGEESDLGAEMPYTLNERQEVVFLRQMQFLAGEVCQFQLWNLWFLGV
jgi:hypothetical protein